MIIARFTSFFISLAISAASFAAGAVDIEANKGSTSNKNDPIQENFGARLTPYPGFLALLPQAIPSGFKEVGHHYTKREYIADFIRIKDGEKIELNISEGDFINFVTSDAEFHERFVYRDIEGSIFIHHNNELQNITLNLVWLNPPKQRVSIYLTQDKTQNYTSRDLIEILQKMTPIE